MRLDRYLSDMGVGVSRMDLRKCIRRGDAEVNGVKIRDPGFAVCKADAVLFGGERIEYHDYEYYMLNKPAGVVTATEDRRQPTVLDLISGRSRRDIFPVGRLDKDTVGLLLITNDGIMAHRLLAPKSHVDKCYLARVHGLVTEEDVTRFAEGLTVDETFTALPAVLEILEAGEESEVRVTIHEGKFHEIRRMFEAVGKGVVYLKRLSMGPLTLDPSLAEGEYRPLTEGELTLLRTAAHM